MKKEAKKELKNMIKIKPYYNKTILGIVKYIFPRLYLKGRQTESGAYLAPNVIVFFVIVGAGFTFNFVVRDRNVFIGM